MRYVHVVAFAGVVALCGTTCHVVAGPGGPRGTAGTEPKVSENKSEVVKSVSGVYIEDVVYALTHPPEPWAPEEAPCRDHTLLLLRSLQNFTLWAVWEWDSVSSQPQGLLFGSRHELGNFDECLGAPWAHSHPELATQYCLADVVLERGDAAARRRPGRPAGPAEPHQSVLDFMQRRTAHARPLDELTWGACVPAACGPRAVRRLLAALLARTHLAAAGVRPTITVTEPCQRLDQPTEFDGLFYAFIAVMGTLSAAVCVCTYLNCRRERQESAPAHLGDKIIKALCLKENSKSLLVMKKGGIEVLYGIRFLTICLIVVDHQVGISNSGPVSDGSRVDQTALSPLGLLLLHDDLFVDTFFLLSGLLTATALCNFDKFPNPGMFILKRYVRLVVGFGVVIFYVCAVFPHTGSGPLWPRAARAEAAPCRRNWWLSVLMLNNYVRSEDMCIVVSWYIPCDFHFFVVTVLVYWTHKRAPRLGLACAGVLALASLVVPGVINYVNGMPAVQLFTYEFISAPRGSAQFQLTYIKSHCRLAAYLVGVCAGHALAARATPQNDKRISQRWSAIGACAGLAAMAATMCLGAGYLTREYGAVEGALYAALNRPAWAAGLALLVACCALGRVPLVSGVLSWSPWAPLSRLAYGLYLTHSLLIVRNTMVDRNPHHNDVLQLMTQSAGVIVLGCACALVLWLVAEAPANNLLHLCLASRLKRETTTDNDNEHDPGSAHAAHVSPPPAATRGASGASGYLPTNLPATVHFSSKV